MKWLSLRAQSDSLLTRRFFTDLVLKDDFACVSLTILFSSARFSACARCCLLNASLSDLESKARAGATDGILSFLRCVARWRPAHCTARRIVMSPFYFSGGQKKAQKEHSFCYVRQREHVRDRHSAQTKFIYKKRSQKRKNQKKMPPACARLGALCCSRRQLLLVALSEPRGSSRLGLREERLDISISPPFRTAAPVTFECAAAPADDNKTT